MLKKWLDAGKCLVGAHQGDWVTLHAGGCEQAQTCLACGQETRRVDHDWGDWRYSEAHRSPIRYCLRCGAGASYLGAELEPEADGRSKAEIAVPPLPAPPRPHVPPVPSPSGPADDSMVLLGMIRAEYEAQVARGQIAPSRQPRYAAMLEELEGIIASPADDLASLQVKSRRIQEMLAGFSSALMDPSRPEPVAAPDQGSRAALLLTALQTLHAYVLAEMGDNQLTGDTGGALAHLVSDLHRCRDTLAQPMSDADLTKFEVESLRPLALAVRQFSLRAHLAMARPVWPTPVVAQHAGAVFYAGSDEVLDLVRTASDDRELRVLVPRRHREPASLRWNQLRESAIAVFDFSMYERSPSSDVAAPVASIAYEFGMAMALGRPVVIVSAVGRGLPFDLDIDPVTLERDGADASRMADAIDQTMYGLQRAPAGSSVSETIERVRDEFGGHDDVRVRVSVANFDEDMAGDPVKTRLVLSTVFGYLGATAPQLLWPAWPVAYPDDPARSCFHVTAFGPPWARVTRDVVRGACPPDVSYVRGDQALDPDIIRSIWDEICGASHIVCDLTGLNANVLVELGMAHALGRNVLLISQDQQPERYFRTLAKHRVFVYTLDTEDDIGALREHVAAFLG